MSKYFIEDTTLTNIANAIRSKDGTSEPINAADFASRIESIPSGGGDTSIEDELIDGTISGEYSNNNVTTLKNYAFFDCSDLVELNLPNVTYIGNLAFGNCATLKTLNIAKTTYIGNYAFQGTKLITQLYLPLCEALGNNPFGNNINAATGSSYISRVIFPKLSSIVAYSFGANSTGQRPINLLYIDCGILSNIPANAFYRSSAETIILRSKTLCTLENSNAFSLSTVANGTGYIYVPQALIEDYKVATNWSTYAEQFRAIEDYPEIVESEVA